MRWCRGLRMLGVLAAAATMAGMSAKGAILNWSNAAGGAASTAGNWSPSQIPVSGDDLTFNLNNTYAVTFNSSTTASRTQTFRRGTVTLTMSSPHTTSTGITVGDLNTDVATTTFTTGTWNSNGPVVVGDALGSNGTLNVNDDDADLILATSAGDMTIGSNAPGAMSLTGGGRVVVADQFVAGSNASSTSNVTISGFVAQSPFPISRLEVLGTSESRFGQGGDATVNISNGALASFDGDLAIALGSASTSTVTVQGAGLVVGATLDVAGDLLMARNASVASPAGVATLNVNDDGRVLVGGTLFLGGDPDGGAATLHMQGDAFISAESLNLAAGVTLDLDGGDIDIDGGALTNSSGLTFDLNGGVGNPVLTMKNGASATLAAVGGIALRVGGGSGANFADFDVRSGADLTINSGQVQLGVGSDDDGGMIINGGGSTLSLSTSNSTLTVGASGDGRFEAELGASVTGDVLQIATAATSNALALIENPGTTAAFNDIYVGGTSAQAGGSGDLFVNAAAVLSMPTGGNVRIWPNGQLDVGNDGVMDAPSSNFVVLGDLTLQDGGLITAGNVEVSSGGRIRGHQNLAGSATLDGSVLLNAGAVLELINGDLEIGDADESNGFVATEGSTITIGAHTLTLNDADGAVVDSVTLTGGTLAAPNGIGIVNNGAIDGTGVITTPELFYNSGGGVITATGVDGITINGTLRNNSGTIDGTKYTFNGPEGGWTGAGAINAAVVFNSGATVNALANMTLGNNTNFGVTFNSGSELHADTRTVTLFDSNGLGLGSVTDMNGGHIICAQPLVVNTGRRLSGRGGSVDCPTLTIFGRLSPGELTGEVLGQTGELTINSDLTLAANTDTDIEIQGRIGPIEYDRVVVNGDATLDGALNISFISGFTPVLGDRFEIMTYDQPIGAFSEVNLPSSPQCVNVLFGETSIVVIVGLAGDLTLDGDVDIEDVAILLSDFGCGGVEIQCDADIDGDGDTDINDLSLQLSNFGEFCP